MGRWGVSGKDGGMTVCVRWEEEEMGTETVLDFKRRAGEVNVISVRCGVCCLLAEPG